MARHVAKNIVAADLARTCEVQLAYVIGVAQPVSVMINTNGTSRIPPDQIAELVRKHFDLRPKPIINYLNLLRPIYKKTAVNGHFGRKDPDFTWENLNMLEKLKSDAGL
jgi:S-adenosylmethionine synthetase